MLESEEIVTALVGTGVGGVAARPDFDPPQGTLTMLDFEERWNGGYTIRESMAEFPDPAETGAGADDSSAHV